jgi:hypothetical protein
MEEMLTDFQEQAERHFCLESSRMMVHYLILGPPSNHIQLANCLEEAVRWLWVEEVEHQEADAEHRRPTELSHLGPGPHARRTMEVNEGHVDIVAANGVC